MMKVSDREQAAKIAHVKDIIHKSKYLVCLKGRSLSKLSGCRNFYHSRDAFDVEEKYGLSPEEILCASFYNTRVEQFYDFYKNEMLSDLGEIPEGLRTLAQWEQEGILKCTITRDIFSLARRAGCKNVIELHGSVYRNQCPHCKEKYSIDFIKESQGVPRCTKCGTTIRPQVQLVGEMVDNALVTKASDEVSKGDILLIVGCHLNDYLPKVFLRYFEGSKVILINEEPHFLDHMADITLYGNAMDILEELGV